MKKKLPHFKNDKEMIKFTDKNDLGDYLEAKDLKPIFSASVVARMAIQKPDLKIKEAKDLKPVKFNLVEIFEWERSGLFRHAGATKTGSRFIKKLERSHQ